MPLAHAPHSAAAGAVYVALILLGLIVWALIRVSRWPLRWCWRCAGTGRLYAPGPGGTRWRTCPHCVDGVRGQR